MEHLEANFSVLVMSIASSACIALGVTPNPSTGKTEKDKKMAKFNIDLLLVLQEKTANNLNSDEKKLIENIITDLQLKYINN